MAEVYSHETYLSPYSWRYGSPQMRAIWSEVNRRRTWRRIWVALAEAQQCAGLVSGEQVDDIRAHADWIDLAQAHAIEEQIQHDLVAELRLFAGQCAIGGAILHAGATSSDLKDNADAIQLCQALDLIRARLDAALETLADQVQRWADVPTLAWTHLQPAEPTTIGYRLANYAQDLMLDRAEVRRVRAGIRGKGFKGAVGTSASFAELLRGRDVEPAEMEARVMAALGLDAFPVASQTYPRKQDWLVLNALAGLAGSLYKFAFDLRLLQSPPFGEWSEPFGQEQVGSSAMPFKRNPVQAETIDSLARLVAALPRVAWDNAAHSLLERTLDDSANRRTVLPEAFLAVDELLSRANRLLGSLRISQTAVARNLEAYGAFAATERLLMRLVRAGADRQEMHGLIRRHSLAAWVEVESGNPNPLGERLSSDPALLRFLSSDQVLASMDAGDYVGDAPDRARALAALIRAELEETGSAGIAF